MSTHSVHEPASAVGNSGPDTSIDLYLSCLLTLKEKIVALLHHYHTLVLQKMECDLGNLVTCNTESFRNQVAGVFIQLNETEVQLNGLEAWAGLPPECFSPVSASSGVPFDTDQISMEAQTLVELVRRLQVDLRSMVSKNSSQCQTAVNTDSVSFADASKLSVAVSQSRSISTPVRSDAHDTPSYPATPGITSCSMPPVHVGASPQVQDTESYANFAYRSPYAIPGSIHPSTRSPGTERRAPEVADGSAVATGSYRSTNLSTYSSTGSMYNPSTSGIYPSPSMHMGADVLTQPPSASRPPGTLCPDPNLTISTSGLRTDYCQLMNIPDQQFGPPA